MAESDSGEASMAEPSVAAMEESWNLMSKAKDFLMTKTCQEVAVTIDSLFTHQETNEYKTALALYQCCIYNFSDFITLKFLKVYLNSSNSLLRFRMIYLLSEVITEFRNRNFHFSLPALRDVKPLVVSCLKMKETKESDVRILRRIVSFVAYDVVTLEDGGWKELNECILELAKNSPLKAFHVFLDVPAAYENFIKKRVMEKVLDKVEMVLLNPEKGRVQDWNLAFETLFKIGVQVTDPEKDSGLAKRVVSFAAKLKPTDKVAKKVMGGFVDGGFKDLKKFLAGDGIFCKYNKDQRTFVTDLALKIASCYKSERRSKKVSEEVSRVVKKPDEYSANDHWSVYDYEIDWYDYLKTLSSLETLRIFALTGLEERSRGVALRQLNFCLSDHTSKKNVIDVSVMRQLQPLLISCLNEEGLSDSMFKILGEVVFHVANEMICCQEDKWFHLWDYIGSQCNTEFEKAVYIFQSLTMMLDDNEFVVPVIDKLLPEISSRLNPPRELLVDNSCWVLAFTGAFCAAIHLIEVSSHADSVKEVTYKMIDSVRELVERGMEVGLVRRAFRDVESIVKKQVKWYSTSDYRFVKGLLWRLYAIKDMKAESRMVLWRINAILERGVNNCLKEIKKSELDWLNKPEA